MSIEVDDIEDIEDVEVEDVTEDTDNDSVSTWSSIGAPSSPEFSVLTMRNRYPPPQTRAWSLQRRLTMMPGESRNGHR
jgi:hypothetical protein